MQTAVEAAAAVVVEVARHKQVDCVAFDIQDMHIAFDG